MLRTTIAFFVSIIIGLLIIPATCGATTIIPAPPQEKNALPHNVLRLPNVHPGRDPVYAYAKTLLMRALELTEAEYGTVELLVSDEEIAQERQLRSLEHDLLDITWSVTSKEREKQHMAIRIPIMAGLFGQRIMLIRADDQRFNSPVSLEQLISMRAVQGYDWPDTRIFRHNHIPVLETTYRASFRIVAEGFADMFPRSVMEIQNEINNLPEDNKLAIEPNVIVSYDSPLFFFVSLDREALANRIAKGLLLMLNTGEFQNILFAQPVYQESLALMKGRTVIEIDNPLLSEQSKAALNKYLPYFSSSTSRTQSLAEPLEH